MRPLVGEVTVPSRNPGSSHLSSIVRTTDPFPVANIRQESEFLIVLHICNSTQPAHCFLKCDIDGAAESGAGSVDFGMQYYVSHRPTAWYGDEARKMLYRAIAALKSSEVAALSKFDDQNNKQFHDRDLYVFCFNECSFRSRKQTLHQIHYRIERGVVVRPVPICSPGANQVQFSLKTLFNKVLTASSVARVAFAE
jgi:hypothetical protein